MHLHAYYVVLSAAVSHATTVVIFIYAGLRLMGRAPSLAVGRAMTCSALPVMTFVVYQVTGSWAYWPLLLALGMHLAQLLCLLHM